MWNRSSGGYESVCMSDGAVEGGGMSLRPGMCISNIQSASPDGLFLFFFTCDMKQMRTENQLREVHTLALTLTKRLVTYPALTFS
jgi:hypothetical protein